MDEEEEWEAEGGAGEDDEESHTGPTPRHTDNVRKHHNCGSRDNGKKEGCCEVVHSPGTPHALDVAVVDSWRPLVQLGTGSSP